MSNHYSKDRENAIDKAIAEYLQLKAEGTPPERNEWLASHPEICDELREFLDDMQILEREIRVAQPVEEKLPQPENQTTPYLVHLSEGTVVSNKYLLESRLGAGGMGEVWVARQNQPIRRRVAIKFIRLGLETRAAQARFEAERQALAMMDHPNIAKVFDGGFTQQGNAYITMELVNGIPLDNYCDEAKLSTSERVDLFVQVCLGVQHAHQKGIVHRDLKPSNILVTTYDGKPVPKIIDFGVAKATGGKLSEESFLTGFGAVVGTLEYMSPEQAGASGQDVDTRADIYSLGVVLYELLTGLRPIDSGRLRAAAFAEMLRLIREEDPPRPSTRLSTDQSISLHAARRNAAPRKLMSLLRGELDWIVMKCLEKDRNRRYPSASGLAIDLQRFLSGDAVEARPPSTWYRISKLSRKHRGAVLGSGLLLLSLLLGLTSTSWAMFRANVAEAEAIQEKNHALAVRNFLIDDLLRQASPELNPRSEKVTVEELLDRAADKLVAEDTLQDNQVAKAELFMVIADTYKDLGDYSKSLKYWTQALEQNNHLNDGDRETRILSAKQGRAAVLLEVGGFAEAEQILKEVIAERLKSEQANSDELMFAQNNLALAYAHQARFEEAIQLFHRTWEMRCQSSGPLHPDTLQVLSNLAGMHMSVGDLVRADELYHLAYGGYRQIGKQDSPNAMACENALVSNRIRQGKLSDAKTLLNELIARRIRVLGPTHSLTLGSRTNLAYVLTRLGDNDGSINESRDVYETLLSKYGESFHETFAAKNVLVLALQNARRFDEAIQLAQELVITVQNSPDVDTTAQIVSTNNLALALAGKGDYARAESTYRQAIDFAAKSKVADIPEALDANHNLANIFFLQKKYSQALDVAKSTLASRQRVLPTGHAATFATWLVVVDSLIELDRPEQAIELIEGKLKSDSALTEATRADLLFRLGRCQIKEGLFELAVKTLESALEIRVQITSEQWKLGQVRSMLGEALAALSQFEEASSALTKAAEELETAPQSLPSRQEMLDKNTQRMEDAIEASKDKSDDPRS